MDAQPTDLRPEDHRPDSPRWHIGARDQRIPVRYLEPGMLLPPSRSWTEGYGHLVIGVTEPAPGNHLGSLVLYDYDETDPQEVVKTLRVNRESSYIYLPEIKRTEVPDEHRARYENASPTAVNWAATGRHPLARELRVGDLLPPRDQRQAFHGPQRVAKLSMAWDGRLIAVLRDVHGTRRYTYNPEETVEFPRNGRSKDAAKSHPSERRLDKLKALRDCKTAYWMTNPTTGQIFRVLQHPYGRGRWPADILEFEPLMVHKDGKPIAVRPPETGDGAYVMDCVDWPKVGAHDGDKQWADVPPVTHRELVDYTLQVKAVTGEYLEEQRGGGL